MAHDKSNFDFLERHNKTNVIDLRNKMTPNMEKLLNEKEKQSKKYQQGIQREQAQQLRYMKVRQQVRADRFTEIVPKNLDREAIDKFDRIYQKLMGHKEEEELKKYVSNKSLASSPSLNALSRIEDKYGVRKSTQRPEKSDTERPSFLNYNGSSTFLVSDERFLSSVAS